jgi:hypothetical protein
MTITAVVAIALESQPSPENREPWPDLGTGSPPGSAFASPLGSELAQPDHLLAGQGSHALAGRADDRLDRLDDPHGYLHPLNSSLAPERPRPVICRARTGRST